MLPLTALTLWLLGFTRTQSMLTTLAPIDKHTGPGQKQATVYQAHVTAKMVTAAAQRGPFRASCLPQSLVLWWLLRRQYIECELCFGVRKHPTQLEAHAWVQCLGLHLDFASATYLALGSFKQAIGPGEVISR